MHYRLTVVQLHYCVTQNNGSNYIYYESNVGDTGFGRIIQRTQYLWTALIIEDLEYAQVK